MSWIPRATRSFSLSRACLGTAERCLFVGWIPHILDNRPRGIPTVVECMAQSQTGWLTSTSMHSIPKCCANNRIAARKIFLCAYFSLRASRQLIFILWLSNRYRCASYKYFERELRPKWIKEGVRSFWGRKTYIMHKNEIVAVRRKLAFVHVCLNSCCNLFEERYHFKANSGIRLLIFSVFVNIFGGRALYFVTTYRSRSSCRLLNANWTLLKSKLSTHSAELLHGAISSGNTTAFCPLKLRLLATSLTSKSVHNFFGAGKLTIFQESRRNFFKEMNTLLIVL